MKIGYPISCDALPGTEHTRERLLAKVFTLRKKLAHGEQTGRDRDRDRDNQSAELNDSHEPVEDEDFGLLYTYALVTGQLGLEIQNVLSELEDLFGVLDDDVLRLQ